MAYKWLPEFTEQFRDDIDTLSPTDRMLVFSKIVDLLNADNPTDPAQVTDIKRMKEARYAGLWRKRAGDWRILYRVQQESVTNQDIDYVGRLILAAVVNRRDL
jgi:mRNA-degrading endonuclease RelE of RelBE toxin-antitoxin system